MHANNADWLVVYDETEKVTKGTDAK